MITDLELWHIYKKKCILKNLNSIDAEDIASTMYLLALIKERSGRINRFQMRFDWLFKDAWLTLFNKNKKNILYCEHHVYHQHISQEDYEDFLSSVATEVRLNPSLLMKQYKVTCSGVELTLSGRELKELFHKEHLNLTDAQFADNLRKRGKQMFLIGDKIYRELSIACQELKVSLTTLHKRYEIQKIKLWVK